MSTVVEFPSRVITDTTDTDRLGTRHVAEKSGLTYRQVDYLVRCGRVPGMDRSAGRPGSGVPRIFTALHVEYACRVKRMVDAGFPINVACTVLADQMTHGLPEVLRLAGGVELRFVDAKPDEAVAL